ncbi:Ig-like V-type domain-containing protein FAM187A [Hemiscyllium ocellatum]|uniref:Ig-like V-type domain-containing protein FAM187A n=1 Tax=Hemiscyllium ocellatum TaxID=170820 RepID=UPI002966CC9C|nr:Ig-like V-type domain-containing protein FAM187A [Hemiscyllium ocellatum]
MLFMQGILSFMLFLWVTSINASEYVIEEKEDIFKTQSCPAFLMFQNTAYLADMTFELPCLCKPEDVTSVVWYYQKHLGKGHTKVLSDFNGTKILDATQLRSRSGIQSRFKILMFNLLVFNSQPQDSGHYMCGTVMGDYFYGYDVDVQSYKGAHITFQQKKEKPMKDLETKTYKIFTSYWDWTVCDRCGVRGEQRRIGLCYMHSPYLYFRYKKNVANVVSCGSSAVPPRYRHLLKKRKPEIMVRSCFVHCPTKYPSTEGEKFIFDVFGFTNDKNKKPPVVPVQTHIHAIGYPLTIACPESRAEHAVAWDRGRRPLYLEEYMVGVNHSMRVYIDQGNHLIFRAVQLNDIATYYCWRQGQLMAGIRLRVGFPPRVHRSFTDDESIFAIQTILSSYFIIVIIFIFLKCMRCCNYYLDCF